MTGADELAQIRTTADEVTIELTAAERLWSLRGDVTVPRAAVVAARVEDDALGQVRGIRAPGLAVPGRLKVGTWRGRWGKDLVAVRRGEAAVVVELDGEPWRRLVVSAGRDRAEAAARALQG